MKKEFGFAEKCSLILSAASLACVAANLYRTVTREKTEETTVEPMDFPCRVGDLVQLEIPCSHILDFDDPDIDPYEDCPFVNDCLDPDCLEDTICSVTTTIKAIVNYGTGWKIWLKDISGFLPVEKFEEFAEVIED
jgi:hypothetical protein